jgi:adenosylcobinamide-phosphate synthase
MDILPAVMPWRDGAPASVFVLAVGLALLIDVVFGEPPAALHPVVWMGRYLGWAGRRFAPAGDVVTAAANKPDYRAFAWGVCFWWIGAILVMVAATVLQAVLFSGPVWAAVVGLGLLFKPLLAWAMLRREVRAVEQALGISLAAGRERLSQLCSRDVSGLDEARVRETAIESLAENLNDSVVAPLFWFVFLGLPGAALYRYANTADAMWGYIGPRDGRDWTWAGRWAARVDDVLSWVPARLTAVLLTLAAGRLPGHTLGREARRTPSPNSGWPMAAMALALGVHLRKPGVYVLNEAGTDPQPPHTARAIALAGRVVLAAMALAMIVIWQDGQGGGVENVTPPAGTYVRCSKEACQPLRDTPAERI